MCGTTRLARAEQLALSQGRTTDRRRHRRDMAPTRSPPDMPRELYLALLDDCCSPNGVDSGGKMSNEADDLFWPPRQRHHSNCDRNRCAHRFRVATRAW